MEHKLTIETLFEMGDSLRQSFIAAASPEERMIGLKPEERVMGLKPEERVRGLEPEQVFGMYKPEERLVGLSREEKRLLMESLQRSLETR